VVVTVLPRALPSPVHPAKVDCETIRTDHLIAQPVNSASSLGYAAAGLYVIATCGGPRPDDPGRQLAGRALGATLVAMGVGSVLFHGPGGPRSKWLHDVPILAYGNTMTAWNLYDSALLPGAGAVALATGSTAAQSVLLAVRPDAVNVQGALSTGVMWASEAVMRLARRSGLPHVPTRPQRVQDAGLALILGSAVLQVLGRSGFPLCRPDSLLQPHAVWHLGSAAALALHALAATGPESGPSPRRSDHAGAVL
jgi:hypothetical protein